MFGFKSLERKLRDGNGQAAAATVLDIRKGHSIEWTNHRREGDIREGTVAKDHYRLRVEPAGEPTFEAQVALDDDKLFGLFAPAVGSPVMVLFDPDDHDRIAIDVQGTKDAVRNGRGERHRLVVSTSGPGLQLDGAQRQDEPDKIAQLQSLADLHDRGALTDAEFAAEKGKLLGD